MKGVKGVLPLGCFPLWGREGVTLAAAEENNQTIGGYEFSRVELLKSTKKK